MRTDIPLGDERLRRPKHVFRYTFDDFFEGPAGARRMPAHGDDCVVTVEAAAPGDAQVVAARVAGSLQHTVDLDRLADVPSVESIIGCAGVRCERELPHVRDFLQGAFGEQPDAATLSRLTGLEEVYAPGIGFRNTLDLAALPAGLRKLAVSRHQCTNLPALTRMGGLVSLHAELYKESLDAIAALRALTRLKVMGEAKGWAKLRDCAALERASFSNVQMTNLKRWDTWKSLRELLLGGRGIKSLAGLEASQSLETLHLVNVDASDLAPLVQLPRLTTLVLRMPAGAVDLASVGRLRALRRLVIETHANSDREILRLPSLAPLAAARDLEELVLLCARVEDGSLKPLADLPRLRRVSLGQHSGTDVDALRAARPGLALEHTPAKPRDPARELVIGKVTANRPGDGVDTWWIFEDLAAALSVATNYAAEKRLKEAVRSRDPRLVRRLEWDTEAGGVAVHASSEADIRAVAEVITALIDAR
jgi:hypothetical protein